MPKIIHKTVLKSIGRGSGWKPDLPNSANDFKLSQKLGDLPRATADNPSLNPAFFPKIRDQGQIGSCTGHGLRSAIAYKMLEHHNEELSGKWGESWDLSPLAMYWFGRREENAIHEDSGCYIRDVVDACRKYGIPTEESWPYDVSRFTRKPSARAMQNAKWHQANNASYRCDEDGNREKTIDRMLQALSNGLPIVYGFTCYANLSQADNNGVVPNPSGALEGGHCVTAYWADTRERLFWGPNSWRNDWGGRAPAGARYNERGYIGLPFSFFLTGDADDAWAVDLEDISK